MTVVKIIGSLMAKPELLLNDSYNIVVEDFEERFHKIVFSVIKNLINMGNEAIDPIDIDNYLSQYAQQHKIFTDNQGFDYLMECQTFAEPKSFAYYYNRLKKFSLLNAMTRVGIDIRDIYDESIVDVAEKEKMVANFEKMTIDDILDWQENLVIDLRSQYQQETLPSIQAGKGLKGLIQSFKETPEIGLPFQSSILNTIVRGARLKKVYMKSLITGGGKSRLAVADVCGFSVKEFYDTTLKKWKMDGFSEPSLYVSTELEPDEIQTMIVAYVSGVEEFKILDGACTPDEEKRIEEAVQFIEEAPLFIVQMPNFTIDSLEILIKEYKLKHKIKYVHFDYLHTSINMLMNASAKAGIRLREDQILFMFAERLKVLAGKLNVYIGTATQLNGDWKDAKEADMNLLRGV